MLPGSSQGRLSEESSDSSAPPTALRKETPRAVVRDLEVEGDDVDEDEQEAPEEERPMAAPEVEEEEEPDEPREDDAMVVNVAASGRQNEAKVSNSVFLPIHICSSWTNKSTNALIFAYKLPFERPSRKMLVE